MSMESKYKSIKHIGEGAFSSVILALNIETGEKVAIKKMKKRRWKDTAAQAEISALQKLHHENIIRLLDVFREDYRSFLVFECMDCDLNELVVSRNGRRLPETVILDITYQVLNGLDFIHRNDLFHRDIKPENVLIRRHVTRAGSGAPPSAIVVEAKIADFGLVHDMDFSRPLTDYISTRWYRAPEVLLNCANYSTPIDVWAVGTIVAELATLRPLFPGTNQIDQLRRIFEVLGTPQISTSGGSAQGEDPTAAEGDSWYEGAVHARKLGIAFVPSTRKPVASVMPDVSAALIQLVDYLLVLNPANRPTAREALVVVSRMLDHTLGEPQESDMDAPSHEVPDMIDMDAEIGDGRRVPVAAFNPPPPTHAQPVVMAAVAASAAKRLLRIPPIMGKTRSTGTLESAASPATPVSATQPQFYTPPAPPAGAGTSRPSVEINIVRELHREPMRDPRADLSDLAVVTKGHPQYQAVCVRSRSVSSVSSMGSTTPQSMAVSPDDSIVFESSGVTSTSSTDLHHRSLHPPGMPGQHVSMRSAIGKASLLSALAQEELAREQRLSLQRPAADTCLSSVSSETSGSHIRRAGAITEFGGSQQPTASSASSTLSVPGQHYAALQQGARNADKRKSEYESDGGSGFVPLRSNGAQTSGQANDRVQGLRSISGVLGSPLNCRAPSTKKKTTTSSSGSSGYSQQSQTPPSQPGSGLLLKRSKSALLAAGRAATPGTTNRLELSPDVQAAAGERIDLSRVGEESSAAPSVSSGKAKKEEWIANMQFLRQRLASNNIGPSNSSVGSSTASESIHQRHMLPAPNRRGSAATGRRCSASSDRPSDGFGLLGSSRHNAYASTASKRSSVAATPVRDISSLLHISPESAAAVPLDDDDDDFLGVRGAMHRVLLASPLPDRDENDQSSMMTLPSPPPVPALPLSATTADASGGRGLLIADSFAPVTFDAAALFRQSLLLETTTMASPLNYREDAVMPSPGDKIATFNDVRIKYSSRKSGAPATGTAGGHRFLSKVKNALTGGHSHHRSPEANSGGRLSSHASRGHGRAKSSGAKAEIPAGSPASASRQQVPAPRLDFDLGISLLTPESLHRVPNKDDGSVLRTDAQAVGTQQPAAAVVANDLAYYLIDYINGQQPVEAGGSGNSKERKDSYASGATPASAAAKARAARRIVNASTRSRQTQYEYSFGSQIFECLDKDLVLLKTDAFREIEEQYGISSTASSNSQLPAATTSGVQPYAQRLSHSLAPHKQNSASSGRPAAPRRKPMDVTKVTAKTAAAINNIVAGNAKARSTVAAASATAASSATNNSVRQLVI
ncbi:hypothetical protein GGI20_000774 [Coemansia sp. BCRC 34301]|nr:hypothetical protein GGI20_000774 [Coemansia sp. BCRC 34301]